MLNYEKELCKLQCYFCNDFISNLQSINSIQEINPYYGTGYSVRYCKCFLLNEKKYCSITYDKNNKLIECAIHYNNSILIYYNNYNNKYISLYSVDKDDYLNELLINFNKHDFTIKKIKLHLTIS